MPTTRHRYTITETDDVAQALAIAAERWPDERDNGGKLLLHALEDWARSFTNDRERHRGAILATSGAAFPDEFDENYREELRQDWPE